MRGPPGRSAGGRPPWGTTLAVALLCLWPPSTARAEPKKKGSGLFDFQTWKTPQGHQQDEVKQLAPNRLDLTPAMPPGGEPRTLRFRLYADSDYRSTVLRWQKNVRAQIDRVNRVVEPVFNVRFQIEGLRLWERSHVGLPFEPILTELEALDPAREVDIVVGLVTPFRGFATSVHQIGGARFLARHFVLRGMDDEQESLALDREFNLLAPEERQRVYAERKAHKETVVFLHEWGHTLGALHEEDPAAIMNPLYDAKRAAFTPFEKELILFVPGQRLARPAEPYPESAGLPDLLRRAPSDEGTDKERASLLTFALERARHASAENGSMGGGGGGAAGAASAGANGAPSPRSSAPAVKLDLPAPDVATYNRAVEALGAHELDKAWTHLAPLTRRYPDQVTVASLACALVAGHARAADARAVCDAALALGPADARPLLDAAAAYLDAKDPTRAAPLVSKAGARVAPGDTKSWMRLASLASAVGALSAADAALGHTDRRDPEARKLIEELEGQRMRLALPRDAARWEISPEREPGYLLSYREAEEVIAGHDPGLARARVRALAHDFPGCPGADVLECEVEIGARHAAAASKLCEAALSKFGQATRALVLLGVIAAQARQTDAAQRYLRKAMLLDPRAPEPWRELAHLYRATHARQSLADLEAQHQALLAAPLPE
jgi:predicted Zn-dependent protease